MDEGWGNLIYLLLIALFGILGSIKKKKKPIEVSPPDDGEIMEQSMSQPNQGNKMESIFEALLGQEVSDPYWEEEKEEDDEPVREQEVALDSVPEQRDPRETSVEYVNQSRTSTLDSLQSIYNEEEEEEEDEIDWRQAIIHKEILDRKYN